MLIFNSFFLYRLLLRFHNHFVLIIKELFSDLFILACTVFLYVQCPFRIWSIMECILCSSQQKLVFLSAVLLLISKTSLGRLFAAFLYPSCIQNFLVSVNFSKPSSIIMFRRHFKNSFFLTYTVHGISSIFLQSKVSIASGIFFICKVIARHSLSYRSIDITQYFSIVVFIFNEFLVFLNRFFKESFSIPMRLRTSRFPTVQNRSLHSPPF